MEKLDFSDIFESQVKLDEAKKSGDYHLATFIEDKIFTEFLRRREDQHCDGRSGFGRRIG